MADPIKYTTSYDFSNFQANDPSSPLPGTRVDIELAEIDRAIRETIAAVADVRRSDGKLANGSVTSDALAPNIVDQVVSGTITTITDAAAASAASQTAAATSATIASDAAVSAGDSASSAATSEQNVLAVEENLPDWRGAWATATVYGTGDLVREEGSTYICVVAHTAAAAFSTDLSALRWELFAQVGATGAGTGDLLAANNLSDVASVATARSNLGVPETSTALLKSGNLSGLANTTTAQANLGLPSGTTGRAVLASATQATAKTALGVPDVIDEDSFATDSATRPPSQQSTKSYVDTRPTWDYVSAATTILPNTVLTFAHGLGVAPSAITVDAICVGAGRGFSVGDVIHDVKNIDGAGSNRSVVKYVPGGNTTQIKVALGATLFVLHPDGTLADVAATFKIIVKAKK